MKLKQATVRQPGQLALPSSFRSDSIPSSVAHNPKESRFKIEFSDCMSQQLSHRPHALQNLSFSSSSKHSKDDDDTCSKPSNICISLSDFLERKVDKTAYRSVQEKEKSFSTVNFGLVQENKEHKQEEESSHFILSGAVFQQFKHKSIAEGYMPPSGKDEAVTVDLGSKGEGGDSRKRKNLFEVSRARLFRLPLRWMPDLACVSFQEAAITKKLLKKLKFRDNRSVCRQRVVVLGDDPKPKQRRKGHMLISKRPKAPFNHYANGSGWWDCNMEGVDSEEVGCHDVWEGVGSTTLGGLEWH